MVTYFKRRVIGILHSCKTKSFGKAVLKSNTIWNEIDF
ncbi:hypothetical protein LEP1GSC125_2360 [Leptospira mayottensis 200901122]|uniref:Uncharacterized protein n=1 Tax=Leptospira mayottensis 200901122 TaxID=1193010 RepID=A0AA87MM83_9LEPT|nr:hypothetical protein LEP1GSC125_2360 [Leptospira mayottensis 200901122]